MLVRAARRKSRLDVIRSKLSSDQSQLQLPWLCPAYNTSIRDRKRWINFDNKSQSSPFAKRRNSKDASSLPPRRALATAVGYGPIDDIPFEGLGGIPPPPPSPNSTMEYEALMRLSKLKPFNPAAVFHFDSSLSTTPIRHRATKAAGIGGEISEMISVFDACLHVGRVERAGVILRRIDTIEPDARLRLQLHNSYLRCAVEQLILHPSKTARQEMHKWFELELVQKDLLPNAETIAYMVKASLQSPDSQRQRLVRRYMDMIPEDTVYEMFCSNYLTAEEVNYVTDICPEYKLAEDPAYSPETYTEMEQAGTLETENQESDDILKKIPVSVRPTGQKGLGLKSLKATLSLFSKLPLHGIDISHASYEEKRRIQSRLEEDAVSSAVDRWREESSDLVKMGLSTSLQTKSIGARMWRWQMDLDAYLKEELVKIDAAEVAEKKTPADTERCLYGPFLRLLPSDKIAAITILSIMTTLSTQGVEKGMTLSNAIMAIANGVEDESAFEVLQRHTKSNVWPSSKGEKLRGRQARADLLKRVRKHARPGSTARMVSRMSIGSDTIPEGSKQWPMSMKAKVGAFLMSALIETSKIPVFLVDKTTGNEVVQLQPAFMHTLQYRIGKKVGVIMANKELVNQLQREPVHSLLAKHLPMLVAPEPWTRFNKGGFIAHPSKMMRIKLGDKDQRHYAEAAIGQGDMAQTFKGLDVLGETSWQINEPVFDIMLEAWNSGEAIANIPSASPVIDLPPEPEASDDPLERRRWIRDVKAIENKKAGMHSMRCFQNFQMEIGRALKGQTFYFPHNVDFRGRAYPIPPYLNHMGADNCRGILKFGEGKKLGEAGLRWLKIHLANVFGFDKASLSERENFADIHWEDIEDSVTNPLKGSRWWLKAEDPWQCLAACIEVRNAIKSGDPANFISYLPVHQDGTCNGLQHYAALGGDTWGAKQVNLEPGDRPADVYTAVADLVKESIAKAKANGVQAAAILDGKITRKTVKQTVMTNVYGVTFVGAKAQVKKQLNASPHDWPTTPTMNVGTLSAYIATEIFTALSTMFRGAHDIQHWLGECASRISKCLTPEQLERMDAMLPAFIDNKTVKGSKYVKDAFLETLQFKSSVIWTTPLHLPVVQPYRLSKSKVVPTHMQKLSLSEPHRSHPVSKRKQLQGFPPNFIHSLDATHMLLSALRCKELGMSFAAVHDSFWTHASDIPAMNDVLRDAFIRIHVEDVIGRLAAEFSARYKGCMYLARLNIKSPAYKKIKAWRLSHELKSDSKWAKMAGTKTLPKLNELALEHQRQKLLRSSDPKDVAKGKAMVTPASIFQEMSAGQDLAHDAEVTGNGLGDISTREARMKVNEADMEPGNESSSSDDLDSMMDSAEQDSEDLLAADETEDSSESNKQAFEKAIAKRSRLGQASHFDIWLPLTFPPVPQKGDFDVTRLRESQYFFS